MHGKDKRKVIPWMYKVALYFFMYTKVRLQCLLMENNLIITTVSKVVLISCNVLSKATHQTTSCFLCKSLHIKI